MSNRFARPENFGHPLRTPLLRQHFVYRAFNAADELLYVGCSMTVPQRMTAHKMDGRWYQHMTRLRLAGPYNYETARQLERDAIHTERPLYNGMTPERVAVDAAFDRIVARRHADLTVKGLEFWAAYHLAYAHAESKLRRPERLEPFRSDDLTIASALRVDREDAATYERIAS